MWGMWSALSLVIFPTLGVVIVTLLPMVAGCNKKTGSSTTHSVVLVASGDTEGWIVPCGCSSGQSGGLLRRASLIAKQGSQDELIYVDVGGAASGVSEYHRTKFESILRGEMAMGLVAHNLGKSELALGKTTLREVATKLAVPFISANALDKNGKQLFQSSVTVERHGHQHLIIGVIDPQFASNDVTITDPREAILRCVKDAMAKRPDGFSGIFVLAYCPRERLIELATGLPEVDAIIGGPTGQTVAPRKIGATIVCSATNKGKFLVAINRKLNNWQASVLEVDQTYDDDRHQVTNLDEFRTRLVMADFKSTETQVGHFNSTGYSSDGNHYAGSESCMGCHKLDSTHWQGSHHAHAWETLQPKRSFADPFCQQCHTTGYAQQGGFQNIASSSLLTNVGCESCHGPSSEHVADWTHPTPFRSRDQCVTCHDRENSPDFEYAGYWNSIVHGEQKTENPPTKDRDVNRQ